MIMVPVVVAFVLFVRYGTETRGLDLRHLEHKAHADDKTPLTAVEA
jgi:hypothetical protein